ncbi:MAG: hypothetical protein LCH58_09105 [Bacteroidetes bacterium]|uniref:hypothetical protein n=1 Tax=Phnomibacter sp. TaxID=2836217 RepID=UPI002FDCA805|nr:hypothetical protein [Bacteroidota bacterium]
MIRQAIITSSTWKFLLHGVINIQDYRNHVTKNSDLKALNATILMQTASAIEGAITSTLIQHIHNSKPYKTANRTNDFDTRRILDDLIEQLFKSQWKDLESKANLIAEIELKTIGKKSWEDIQHLFKLRNLLAHGGSVIYKLDLISNENSEFGTYVEKRKTTFNKSDLFQYLKKKNLIHDISNERDFLLESQFLTSAITNHFSNQGLRFLQSFLLAYSNVRHPTGILKNDIESTIQKIQSFLDSSK